MSGAGCTGPSVLLAPMDELMSVSYHGNRRNAVPDIFQDVDLEALMAKLRWPETGTSTGTSSTSCVTPGCRPSGEKPVYCAGADGAYFAAGCEAARDRLDGQLCSRVRLPGVEERTSEGDDGSCSVVRVTCLWGGAEHGVPHSQVSSLRSLADHAVNTTTNSATTSHKEEPSLTYSSSSTSSFQCGELNDSYHGSVAAFHPEQCAKRSLIF